MYATVVLSGGTALFQVTDEGMTKEGVGSIHDEDEGVRFTSVKVPNMDWRIYLVCLRIFSRCGPRRASTMNPPLHYPQMSALFFLRQYESSLHLNLVFFCLHCCTVLPSLDPLSSRVHLSRHQKRNAIKTLRSDLNKMSAKMADEVVCKKIRHQGSAASTVSGSTGSGGTMGHFTSRSRWRRKLPKWLKP